MGRSSSALPHTNLCFDYGMLVNIKFTLKEEKILPFKSLQILFQNSSKVFSAGLPPEGFFSTDQKMLKILIDLCSLLNKGRKQTHKMYQT